MTARFFRPALALALLSAGCWGDNEQLGNTELFRVTNPQAQFIKGHIIGAELKDAGSTPPPPQSDTGPPGTSAPTGQTTYYPGQSGGSFGGDATDNTVSIGITLDGVSSGYWVVPVSGVDVMTRRFLWNVSADFGRDIPVGSHNLRVVAIDGRGRAGKQAVTSICIRSLVTDNLQSCSKRPSAPQAVITLTWDVNADVDLQVVEPDGNVLEPKRPPVEKNDAGQTQIAPATFDHDSNASCQIDGFRVENLAWQTVKPEGRYLIYANLFDACKQGAVRFGLSIFEAEGEEDGGKGHLVLKKTARGELLDIQANGGAQRGLYVTDYIFH